MKKNTLLDLNDHLFAELERLGNMEIKGDELTDEIRRAKSACEVATRVLATGRLVLDAARAAESLPAVKDLPLLSCNE